LGSPQVQERRDTTAYPSKCEDPPESCAAYLLPFRSRIQGQSEPRCRWLQTNESLTRVPVHRISLLQSNECEYVKIYYFLGSVPLLLPPLGRARRHGCPRRTARCHRRSASARASPARSRDPVTSLIAVDKLPFDYSASFIAQGCTRIPPAPVWMFAALSLEQFLAIDPLRVGAISDFLTIVCCRAGRDRTGASPRCPQGRACMPA